MYKKLIKYNQQGGVIDAASYMIPIYGTYRSIKDAIDDPTLGNIGMAGLSAASDIGTLFGVGAIGRGALGALKAGKAASKAVKLARATKPQIAKSVWKAEGAATKAARNYDHARKLAVPVNQFAENQVWLKSLNQQKQNAIKKLYQSYNQRNAVNALSAKSPVTYGIQQGWKAFPSSALTTPIASSAAKAAGVMGHELSR